MENASGFINDDGEFSFEWDDEPTVTILKDGRRMIADPGDIVHTDIDIGEDDGSTGYGRPLWIEKRVLH